MLQVLRLSPREIEFVFRWQAPSPPTRPQASALTAEAPLPTIVGLNSVLTANGPRHLRQRKLLPAVPRRGDRALRGDNQLDYGARDRLLAGRQADRPGAEDAGDNPRRDRRRNFRIADSPRAGTPEYGMRTAVKCVAKVSTRPLAKVGEPMNISHAEPIGLQRRGVELLDRFTYPVIGQHRVAADLEQRTDILSLIMRPGPPPRRARSIAT